MNKILYEASYIGSPKSLFDQLSSVITTIVLLILVLFMIKKARKEKETYSSNAGKEYFLYRFKYIFLSIFALILGLSGFVEVCGTISTYNEVILGYKRGEYREVEGIVEDYPPSGAKVQTFTVNGVEFQISEHRVTWGYTYWHGKNVITGNGQHLRIRYIPGSNSIVYIEELAEKQTVETEESLEEWMSRNVREVCISNPMQEDINRIGNMENLRSLTIESLVADSYYDIDFSPLTNLSLLQELTFDQPGGDDIDFNFIKDMPDLSNICFRKCTAIKDLSLFEDMSCLHTLDVSYVDDVDLNRLSGCEFLHDIRITGGHIRNAGGLSNLKHLQHISMCETQPEKESLFRIRELYQHSDMEELESVELRHIHVIDIGLLARSSKISWIRLVDTGIDDIEPLHELKHLKHLEIFGNESEKVKEQAELYFGDIEWVDIREDIPYGL